MTRTIGELELATYAAPDYVHRFGVPVHPRDLAHHELIAFSQGLGQVRKPTYVVDGKPVPIEPARIAAAFDDGGAMEDAARAGLGLTQVTALQAGPALARGELVQVLTGWDAPGPSLHAVYAPGPHLSRRVRAFLDFLGQCHLPRSLRQSAD